MANLGFRQEEVLRLRGTLVFVRGARSLLAFMSARKLGVFSCEKQLYKRLCPSVGLSMGPSVGQAFLENREFM